MSARQRCSNCLRPMTVCLCSAIHRCQSSRSLTILQDPTEAKHPLSTAPLLKLSIEPSRLLVGEVFSAEDLFPHGLQQVALLYPLPDVEPLTLPQAQAMEQLIILDGTWRKVRRLLHLNPWLRTLPCIALQPQQTSQYRVRKSPREDGLSTLEASAHCLSWIDQDPGYLDILSVQDRMVTLQESYQMKGGHK